MADDKQFFVTMGTTVTAANAESIPLKELKEGMLAAIKLENLTLLNVTEIKEAVYETIPEDKAGENKVPGNTHRGPQSDNGMGTVGKQESSKDRKEMQGHEHGAGERNNPGQTSSAGKAS